MTRYDVIMPDPPWWYANMPKANGGIEYKRMKLPELIAMKPTIEELSHDHTALCMWFTGPHFETAIDLGRAWGFRWVTALLIWCKTGPHDPGQGRLIQPKECDDFNIYTGSGRYSKHATEYLGLWRRGSLRRVADRTVRQVIHEPVRQHSRKPDEAYHRVARMWPDVPRLEMFARTRRPGWDAWGNEVDKFKTEEP